MPDKNNNNHYNYYILLLIIIFELMMLIIFPVSYKIVFADSGDFEEEQGQITDSSVEYTEEEIEIDEYDPVALDEEILNSFQATATDNGIMLMSSSFESGDEEFSGSGGTYGWAKDGLTPLLNQYLESLGEFSVDPSKGIIGNVIENVYKNSISTSSDADKLPTWVSDSETFGGSDSPYLAVDSDGNLHVSSNFFNLVNNSIKDQVVALQGYYALNCNNLTGNSFHSTSVVNLFSEKAYQYFFNETYENIFCFVNVNSSSYISFSFFQHKYGYLYDKSVSYLSNDGFSSVNIFVYDDGRIEQYSNNSRYDMNEYYISRSKTFGVCKLFYSQADYNDEKFKGETSGNKIYYAPTYNPGNVTIDNRVINYVTQNPGSNLLSDFVGEIIDTAGDIAGDVITSSPDKVDDIWSKLWNVGELLVKVLEAMNSGGGGGSGGGDTPAVSGKDYTEILEKILNAIKLNNWENFFQYLKDNNVENVDLSELEERAKHIDDNLNDLLILYKQYANKDNCPYDFNELENFLDKLWLQCKENQENMKDILDSSKTLQQQTANRLDSIYERLGQLPNYSDILTQILIRLDFLSLNNSSDDENDLLEEIKNLLEENNKQNDEILNKFDEALNEIKSGDNDTSLQSSANSTVEIMKTRFPFSIPFDFANLFNAISAEPVTPVIKVPILVQSLNIQEELVIDLHPFDSTVEKFRGILVALFAAGLMIFTLKYIIKDDK